MQGAFWVHGILGSEHDACRGRGGRAPVTMRSEAFAYFIHLEYSRTSKQGRSEGRPHSAELPLAEACWSKAPLILLRRPNAETRA